MYPNSADEMLEALTLQEANLPTYLAEVGGTAEDVKENNEDRANLAQALENQALADANKEAATQIKNAVYDGDPSEAVAPYPSSQPQPLPYPDAMAGVESRYNARRKRFKAQKTCTKEIAIAIGLEKATIPHSSPDSLNAAAKVKDLGNYQFEADYKKQGMSGMTFQWRVKGTEKWSNPFNTLQSPAVISIDQPAVQGASVEIEIRCRLLSGNNQVGNWSPIYSLTITA